MGRAGSRKINPRIFIKKNLIRLQGSQTENCVERYPNEYVGFKYHHDQFIVLNALLLQRHLATYYQQARKTG